MKSGFYGIQTLNKMTKQENEILEATKEFAEHHKIPYDERIESMILNAMREAVKNCADDYGTNEYCTCDKHVYDEHTCPYAEDISGDSETLCTCCPYCEHQCCMDI